MPFADVIVDETSLPAAFTILTFWMSPVVVTVSTVGEPASTSPTLSPAVTVAVAALTLLIVNEPLYASFHTPFAFY